MSKMSELDFLVQLVVDLMDLNIPKDEAIDAIILTESLTPGETRNIIQALAMRGIK